MNSLDVVKQYFKAFNEGRSKDMINLLHPDVAHDINQGKTEVGKEAFIKFMDHMDNCYKEKLENMIYFVSENSKRVSVEFEVNGTYLKTDGTLPEARGQKYVISAGSFLEVEDNLIKRVTTYYNLPLWIEMVKSAK